MSSVLVVEDEPLGADAARDFLECMGHSVRIVPTPTAAARLIVSSRPDVVLSDRCLPPYDGQALQAVCDRLTIPLIDLGRAICLMGRTEPRSEHAPSNPSSSAS
jgi:CheY-like chemotaxis protein